MQVGFLPLMIGLALAAALGYGIAWLIRGQALDRSTTYRRSLEQLLSGTTRDRDMAVERERARVAGALALQEEQAQRLAELEKELAHRELQVVTFREEAIQLARIREELGQRLARRDHTVQELEAALARTRERASAAPDPGLQGSRVTGPERELAALMAAHEQDLAELEARYLGEARTREGELEELRRQVSDLARDLGEREAQLADARALLAEFGARALSAEARTQELEREPRDTAPGRLAEATVADSAPAPAARPVARSRRSRRKEVDDLKQIPGIDSRAEDALHQLGVTTFRQIARWKDKDIERVAGKLEETVERIRSEGWVESARREHEAKYGRAP